MNNRIAAIGTMSGTMSTEDLTNCVPTYVTPVIHFHGTADATVPFDTGALPSLELVPATINFWVNAHGCAVTSDSTQIVDSAADGYTVDRFVYQSCTPLESVEFWRINGGDHEYFYQPNNDFTESIEIWKFFNKWTHSNPAQAGLEKLMANGISISPNPTEGLIEVTTKEIDVLEVYSTTGKLLHSQNVSAGTTAVDLSKLRAGIYVVKLNSLPEVSERIVVQ